MVSTVCRINRDRISAAQTPDLGAHRNVHLHVWILVDSHLILGTTKHKYVRCICFAEVSSHNLAGVVADPLLVSECWPCKLEVGGCTYVSVSSALALHCADNKRLVWNISLLVKYIDLVSAPDVLQVLSASALTASLRSVVREEGIWDWEGALMGNRPKDLVGIASAGAERPIETIFAGIKTSGTETNIDFTMILRTA